MPVDYDEDDDDEIVCAYCGEDPCICKFKPRDEPRESDEAARALAESAARSGRLRHL